MSIFTLLDLRAKQFVRMTLADQGNRKIHNVILYFEQDGWKFGLDQKRLKSDQWSYEGGGSKAKTLTMPGQMEELKS